MSWGIPDVVNLRKFFHNLLGWDSDEIDRAVIPVLKRMESENTSRQTRLESYFMKYEDDIKFANVRSKRLRAVLGKVNSDGCNNRSPGESIDGILEEGPNEHIEVDEVTKPKTSRHKRKKKATAKSTGDKCQKALKK